MNSPVHYNASETELEVFIKLPPEERQRVDDLLHFFGELLTKRRGRMGVAFQNAAVGELAHLSLSPERLSKLFRAWRREGWRALVRKYKTDDAKQPPAFVQYWQALCEKYQRRRGMAAAFNVLRKQYQEWAAGDITQAIPGLGPTPPPPAPGSRDGMPDGLGLRNLRRYRSEKIDEANAKQGRHNARELLPSVMRTRIGLEPGQVYMADDLWHNSLMIFPGQPSPVRTLELCFLDVPSGSKVHFGFQPRLESDTGKRLNLSEEHMVYLAVSLLAIKGYHPKGCLIIVEGGTATIRKELAERIYKATNGLVRVQVGGTDRRPAFLGDWASPAKGNPRLKALLEGLHGFFLNRLSALPGQVGKDASHAPGRLTAQVSETEKLLNVASRMDADLAEQMPYAFPPYVEYLKVVHEIYDEIDERTDHNLEGYEANGWVTAEIPGLPAEAARNMPPKVLEAMINELAKTPGGIVSRKLSPREVWNRYQPKLKKLPASMIPFVMGEKFHEQRKVTDRMVFDFTFKGSSFTFLAQLRTGDGHEYMLKPGRSYTTVFNPLMPEMLHILGDKGEYLGACPAKPIHSYLDQDGINEQMGLQAKLLAESRHRVGFKNYDALSQTIKRTVVHESLMTQMLERVKERKSSVHTGKPIETGEKATEADFNAIYGGDGTAAAVPQIGAEDPEEEIPWA